MEAPAIKDTLNALGIHGSPRTAFTQNHLKHLILVTGPPAAGKSIFAHILSRRLGLPAYSKDMFKEVLFDHFQPNDFEESSSLSRVGTELLWKTTEVILGAGGSVILDSNLRARDRHKIRALAAVQGAACSQVHLTARADILVQRFVEREASAERHPGHRGLEFLDEIKAGISDGRYEVDFGYPRLVVDTSESSETMLEDAVRWVVERT